MASHFSVSLKVCLMVSTLLSCTEQYDPSKNRAQMQKELDRAKTVRLELTETGALPDAGAKKGPSADELYASYCANCHGADGGGNGPGAGALNPKPRNFHDATWQASVDDAHIHKVIKDGGTSVGLAASMAAWGAVLKEDQINEMVIKVRSFKK